MTEIGRETCDSRACDPPPATSGRVELAIAGKHGIEGRGLPSVSFHDLRPRIDKTRCTAGAMPRNSSTLRAATRKRSENSPCAFLSSERNDFAQVIGPVCSPPALRPRFQATPYRAAHDARQYADF